MVGLAINFDNFLVNTLVVDPVVAVIDVLKAGIGIPQAIWRLIFQSCNPFR